MYKIFYTLSLKIIKEGEENKNMIGLKKKKENNRKENSDKAQEKKNERNAQTKK